jgi:hypothetical protein
MVAYRPVFHVFNSAFMDIEATEGLGLCVISRKMDPKEAETLPA